MLQSVGQQEIEQYITNQANLDKLLNLARKMSYNNLANAQDLCQATIERALTYSHTFKTGSNINAWFYRIMYNHKIDVYRRGDVLDRHANSMDDAESSYKPTISPNQEINLLLEEVIGQLDKTSLEYKLLCDMLVGGNTTEQLVDKYNLPEGTLKSILRRFRVRLNDYVEGRRQSAKPNLSKTYKTKNIAIPIDAEIVPQLISYLPESGQFIYKPTGGYRIVGDRTQRLFINRKYVPARYVAWLLMTGKWPEYEVVHRNNDQTDLRWCNLTSYTA